MQKKVGAPNTLLRQIGASPMGYVMWDKIFVESEQVSTKSASPEDRPTFWDHRLQHRIGLLHENIFLSYKSMFLLKALKKLT